MTTTLAIVWTVIIVMAAGFLWVVLCLFHAKASRWWECSWCGVWFNRLGWVRKERPADIGGVHSHGLCPACLERQKTEILRLNLERRHEFYPRNDATRLDADPKRI